MDLIKEKIEINLKLIGIGDDFYPEVKVKWKELGEKHGSPCEREMKQILYVDCR